MFSVRPITNKRTLARSYRLKSLFSVVGFGKKKKRQASLGSFSFLSSSVPFSSQFFCVTMGISSVCFPLNGNCNAPVTSGAIWCESWPWWLLETEDVISWTGAPVLRERRCVVDTSRNCSAVFPHSRNLY